MRNALHGLAYDNSMPMVAARFGIIALLGRILLSEKPYQYLPKGKLRDELKKKSIWKSLTKNVSNGKGVIEKIMHLENAPAYLAMYKTCFSPVLRSGIERFVTSSIAQYTDHTMLTEIAANMLTTSLFVVGNDNKAKDKKKAEVAVEDKAKDIITHSNVVELVRQMPNTILVNAMASSNVLNILGAGVLSVFIDLWSNGKEAKTKNDKAKIELFNDQNIRSFAKTAICTALNLGFVVTIGKDSKIVCDLVSKAAEEIVTLYELDKIAADKIQSFSRGEK